MQLNTLSPFMRATAGAAMFCLGLVLASCSDDKKEDAAKETPAATTETSTAADSKPADAAATTETKPVATAPAVEVPKAEGSVDVAKLMEPGALPDISVGKADAPVTIVEYMSMTCPHCARFHINVFEPIKEKYVDTGKVRFIVREFPLDLKATAAIMLARCAPEEQFFPLVTALFQQQINWATAEDTRAALLQMGKLAGFTQESFNACLTNQKLLDDVNAVKNKADKTFGVQSTPTFFINGQRYSGEMSVAEMSAIIEAAN